MTIPFIEQCLTCDIGGATEYEYFHPANFYQVVSLREHLDTRDGRNLYVHRLNLRWFGNHGIGENQIDY